MTIQYHTMLFHNIPYRVKDDFLGDAGMTNIFLTGPPHFPPNSLTRLGENYLSDKQGMTCSFLHLTWLGWSDVPVWYVVKRGHKCILKNENNPLLDQNVGVVCGRNRAEQLNPNVNREDKQALINFTILTSPVRRADKYCLKLNKMSNVLIFMSQKISVHIMLVPINICYTVSSFAYL